MSVNQCPFGILGAGHGYRTDFYSSDGIIYNLIETNAGNFDHVIAFIHEDYDFEDDKAASVFYRLLSKPNDVYYLGMLSNKKRSSIFRIQNMTKYCKGPFGIVDLKFKGTGEDENVEFIMVIEHLHTAENRVSDERFQCTDYSTKNFFIKWLTSFYNYLVSFGHKKIGEKDITEAYIPIQAAHAWYQMTHKRILRSPSFWNYFKIKV